MEKKYIYNKNFITKEKNLFLIRFNLNHKQKEQSHLKCKSRINNKNE